MKCLTATHRLGWGAGVTGAPIALATTVSRPAARCGEPATRPSYDRAVHRTG